MSRIMLKMKYVSIITAENLLKMCVYFFVRFDFRCHFPRVFPLKSCTKVQHGIQGAKEPRGMAFSHRAYFTGRHTDDRLSKRCVDMYASAKILRSNAPGKSCTVYLFRGTFQKFRSRDPISKKRGDVPNCKSVSPDASMSHVCFLVPGESLDPVTVESQKNAVAHVSTRRHKRVLFQSN